MNAEEKNAKAPIDPTRRMMLAAVSGFAGAAALASCKNQMVAQASEKADGDAEEAFSGWNRQRAWTKDEMDGGTPWTAKQTGNFDLNDPVQNNLAKLKMTNNLVGERTYITMLVRHLIGREELPGGLVLGSATMFTWQLQVPDPEEFPNVPDGTALMRSMLTAVYLDPHTMEPVTELRNPLNGKMMKLEDWLFIENFLSFPLGGTQFVEELQFANDDPQTPKMNNIKQWGDELILFQGGVYNEPGVHQPRFTENSWRSSYEDVMNPETHLISTTYSFSGVKKAYEKPWMGYTPQDKDLFLSSSTGKKVHSADNIPDFHKRVVVEKYPDRI